MTRLMFLLFPLLFAILRADDVEIRRSNKGIGATATIVMIKIPLL
jgi:hypothetical protein